MVKTAIFTILFTTFAQATEFKFEPYFDAQYACNYFEGQNSKLTITAENLEQAIALAESTLGQNLNVTCNQDIYMCVHKNGDVEPRVVEYRSTEKSLAVMGGSLTLAGSYTQLAQIGELSYHRNLRRLPRCKY
jgi:hypothetical protein